MAAPFSATLAVLVSALVLASAGCDDGAGADADAGVDADAFSSVDADDDADLGPPCTQPCGAACCDAGQVCVRDLCIDEVSCAGGEPCQGDSFCEGGLCVPFGPPFQGYDEGCIREVEPLDSFELEVQCEWPGDFEIADAPGYTSVLCPPLVADLDGDGVPEIVFSTTDSGGVYLSTSTVRAISGDTCEPVWSSEPIADSHQALALADLDGDGAPEVCGRGGDFVPFCLASDGNLLWMGHDATGNAIAVDSGKLDIGLSVANVDGVGDPELVVGLSVFDGPTGELIGGRPAPDVGTMYWSGIIPALTDLDGDGRVEALTGGWVYDLVRQEVTQDWGRSQGHTAVAELSGEHDGPEVVVVSGGDGQVRVHASDGTLLYEHVVPGGGGGPPTVADLDGDGFAEFSTPGCWSLTAFDLDCVGIHADASRPGTCAENAVGEGVLWTVAGDDDGGRTGSSVFDFEGDGAVEILFAGLCWVRVYDGATGELKLSMPHNSGTGIEYPVVADVDGDFASELVVTHHGYDFGCPGVDPLMPEVTREPGRLYTGITVYRDRQDRWAPSRPLWSQHAEHFYQRNDDGTVPAVELPSWEPGRYNSYRQAHPPQDIEAYFIPDLTVGGLVAPACDSETRRQLLAASVCNRGTLPVAAGVLVSFRLDSPDGAELCAASTTGVLRSGDCEDVECTWEGVPIEETHTVHAVVDPDDDHDVVECHEDNNGAADEVRCPPLLQ
jgi:hypothetical protein